MCVLYGVTSVYSYISSVLLCDFSNSGIRLDGEHMWPIKQVLMIDPCRDDYIESSVSSVVCLVDGS